MLLLLALADIASAPNFVKRCQQGLVKIAGEVLSEDPATDLHDDRVRLARRILLNPLGLAPLIAQTAACNENIGNVGGPDEETEAGDGALLYVLRSVYNEYLGTA